MLFIHVLRRFTVFAFIAAGILPAAEPPPNIVFILADDLGWTALSCYGNRDVATPNLDRLASQGMRFTAAYADAQCSPTRAALLSGQYGARTGVFRVIHEDPLPHSPLQEPSANIALSPDVGNLARALRDAGYATGLSGKWHVADEYSADAALKKFGARYFDSYGFDYCGALEKRNLENDKNVDAITDDMLGFIERNRNRPFFAYFAHHVTHTVLHAPRALVDKFAAKGYARSSSPYNKASERPTAEFLATLDHFDQSVGRVLERLDALDLTRRTIVIFTSDNGGLSRMASNAPLREGKGSPYEGGIRVPLIVRWPGQIKPGSESDVPVHTVDYYPTLMDVAHASPPQGHVLDGESMVSLWRQTGSLQRDTLFWHMPTYTSQYGKTPCAIVRKGDWKLIHWFGDYLDSTGLTPDVRPYGRLVLGPRTELYRVSHDISETRDLAAEAPLVKAELTETLEKWWRETGAGLPVKNPAYRADSWHVPAAKR